ncbi:hypothetical protein JHS3_05640 [Jeongeupia sp. HS-3]|uniref:DUF7660 family protein n=1 Tax=Jeongeupia sp. HS-3 TaxID=1009682 RepID=UPI0018A65F0D|nr:hypothetical protein [Jeongeupia sp. HS-3]BCL74828.1 hypothetical protein JHS3_05640 [Jeongeupia sp. HS-3]
MTLYDQLQNVTDPTSFLVFVRALIADRQAEAGQPLGDTGRGANGWENHSIEDFLEAALTWAETTHLGKTQGLNDASPWKRFAMFLYCGKIYE